MAAARKPSNSRGTKGGRLSSARRTAMLKALADPRRFELLERIANAGSLSCSQALECIDIAPATLSHHLKELESAGIIETRREGKFHFMSVCSGVLESLASTLTSVERKSRPKS